MSVAKELRGLFTLEQLQELDAVSAEMRKNPQALDNHNRSPAGELPRETPNESQ